MRALLILLWVLFLCSCDSLVDLAGDVFLPEASKEVSDGIHSNTNEPYLLLQSSDEKITLSQFNRSNSVLTLSDQIVFPFLLEKERDPEFYQVKKDQAFKVRVSSLCSSVDTGDKATKEFFGFEYKSQFTFLNIIPEELLTSSEKRSFTCSFIFVFKKEEGENFTYIVTPQVVDLFHKEKGLVLKDRNNKKLNLHASIKRGDVEKVFLVKQDSQLLDQYRFICDGFSKGVSFHLKDSKDSFLISVLSQKNLPKGVKNCRVISEKSGFINGMTQLFKINFDKLAGKKKVLNISNLSFDILKKGNPSLTLKGQNFGYIHKNTSREKNYPFSIVRFTGLPEDFSFNKYEDVQVFVHNICSTDLNSDVFEKEYQFLLSEEFSLMSITPERFFQLEKKKKYTVECTFELSLKGYDSNGTELSLTFDKNNYTFHWSSGSYGVNLSNHVGQNSRFLNANDSSPNFISLSSIREEEAGSFHLVFLNQLANKLFWSSYPDKMSLVCNNEDDSLEPELRLNFFSLELLGSSVPVSLLFSHPSVESYFEQWDRKEVINCRLLFYTNQVLKYFSSEISVRR